MPEDVRRAKRIRYKMTDRADIGVGDGATAEDFIATDVPTIPFDQFDSDDDSPDAIGQIVTASAPSAVNSQANEPSSTNAEETTPRPLVHHRAPGRERKDDGGELMSLLKAQIIQDGIRRDEEHERRDHERKDRDEERRNERERRGDEARRHDRLMEMMMMMICKGHVKDKPDSD